MSDVVPNSPVCIAGMHRSGTSMITRMLKMCGMYLGEDQDMMPAQKDNPEGFWENLLFVRLNDRILSEFGGGWDYPPSYPNSWECRQEMQPYLKEAMDLIRRFGARPRWGWKDPRNSLTFQFWRHAVPNLKAIVCLRNPLDVVSSLQTRSNNSYAFCTNLWLTYYKQLFQSLTPDECLLTHFDAYFSEPQKELRRILAYLEWDVDDETVEKACSWVIPGMKHTQSSELDLILAENRMDIVGIYQILSEKAGPVYRSIRSVEQRYAFGEGFYPEDGDWRWMSKSGKIYVDLRTVPHSADLQFKVWRSAQDHYSRFPFTLRIEGGGLFPYTFRFREGQQTESLRFRINREEPIAGIRLTSELTFIPRELGLNQDVRCLSVRVGELGLAPVYDGSVPLYDRGARTS
jgi:hypothetical protein